MNHMTMTSSNIPEPTKFAVRMKKYADWIMVDPGVRYSPGPDNEWVQARQWVADNIQPDYLFIAADGLPILSETLLTFNSSEEQLLFMLKFGDLIKS